MDGTQILQETILPQELSEESSWETHDSEEDSETDTEPQHRNEVLRCCRRECSN
jgi:hypothetical protein